MTAALYTLQKFRGVAGAIGIQWTVSKWRFSIRSVRNPERRSPLTLLLEARRLRLELGVVADHADLAVGKAAGCLGFNLQSELHRALGPLQRCSTITTAFRIASNDLTGRTMSISTDS